MDYFRLFEGDWSFLVRVVRRIREILSRLFFLRFLLYFQDFVFGATNIFYDAIEAAIAHRIYARKNNLFLFIVSTMTPKLSLGGLSSGLYTLHLFSQLVSQLVSQSASRLVSQSVASKPENLRYPHVTF